MVNQYVLKVYPLGLGNEVYRTLEICGDSTLDQLCDAIMEAFDFFHEHLYEFCMDNKMFSEHCYQYNPMAEELGMESPSTDIALDKIGLQKGQKFTLHYDFGDNWMFPIRVMEIKQIPRKKKPCVIKAKGRDSAISELILTINEQIVKTAQGASKKRKLFGRKSQFIAFFTTQRLQRNRGFCAFFRICSFIVK